MILDGFRGHLTVFVPELSVILLAEDDEDHVLLVRRAFKNARLLNPLCVVRNGEAAIAYLEGRGVYANRAEYPLPSLLLLDLKMPRRDGFEVLKLVRAHPKLSALRVVVLTTSSDMRDVNLAYQLSANSFLTKPTDFAQFVKLVEALQGYWLWVSKEPEIERGISLESGTEQGPPAGSV